MKSEDLVNGKNHTGKESVEKEVKASQMERKAEPADIIWVKNRGGSWWPAQVVDENLISQNRKPRKRSARKVLVRLYGTYTYSYVDPIKWRSEFDTKILEQNNGSYREVLLKALERDVAGLRAGESKRQRSKSKDTPDTNKDKSQQPKKDADQKKTKPNSRSIKNGNHDASKKNLKRNSASSATEGKKRKNKQDGMQKKRGSNEQITEEADGNLTPKHDKVLKKRKPNSSSPETCVKSQELSTRRLKVMQSLGLAAPPGSPFCKNRQAYINMT